jgi:hypothetical protein
MEASCVEIEVIAEGNKNLMPCKLFQLLDTAAS